MFLKIHSAFLFLFIERFSPFPFKVIIDREGYTIVNLLIGFYLSCSSFVLFLSFFVSCWFFFFFGFICCDSFLSFFCVYSYFLCGFHRAYIKYLITVFLKLLSTYHQSHTLLYTSLMSPKLWYQLYNLHLICISYVYSVLCTINIFLL